MIYYTERKPTVYLETTVISYLRGIRWKRILKMVSTFRKLSALFKGHLTSNGTRWTNCFLWKWTEGKTLSVWSSRRTAARRIPFTRIVGFNKDGTSELRNIFGEGGVFPQPKPVKFIKFLLELLRSKDAIILDSFAGSGTTGHAVLAPNREDGGNRQFILVELESQIAQEITAVRLQRVIEGYASE